MQPLIFLLAGLALGFLLGWLARPRRATGGADPALEQELRRQLACREDELAAARQRQTELTAAAAAAEEARAAADRLAENHRREGAARAEALDQLRPVAAAAQAELAAARSRLEASARDYERQLQDLRDLQARALNDLRDAFKALSNDALGRNAEAFLRLAGESFATLQEGARGDLARRQDAIAALLKPIEEQMRAQQTRLQQSETSHASLLTEVRTQLEALTQRSQSLADETQRFRMVLKSGPARGRWGEETLRRVVEAAGMSAHCDFLEQTQAEDSQKQPDMIVKLPGDRQIIVDAKVPDLDFLNALDAADSESRAQALAAHAAKLRETIRALAAREYPARFPNTLDHVVLFLPAESLFSAALEADRELLLWAAGRRVMLATPASLIALLRSVSLSWQQHAQTENAREIAEAARTLYTRVATFTEHFEKIRTGLTRATEAFNAAAGSFERMVRPSGERLLALRMDADAARPLAELKPLDLPLRLAPGNGEPAP